MPLQVTWRDELHLLTGKNWMHTAQNRSTWKKMEEAYVILLTMQQLFLVALLKRPLVNSHGSHRRKRRVQQTTYTGCPTGNRRDRYLANYNQEKFENYTVLQSHLGTGHLKYFQDGHTSGVPSLRRRQRSVSSLGNTVLCRRVWRPQAGTSSWTTSGGILLEGDTMFPLPFHIVDIRAYHRFEVGVGDRWLVSCLGVLHLNRGLFYRVVPADQSFVGDQYCGLFRFRIQNPKFDNFNLCIYSPRHLITLTNRFELIFVSSQNFDKQAICIIGYNVLIIKYGYCNKTMRQFTQPIPNLVNC
ncbi:hypothetical protein HUJ04_008278 [Dendroctonus ponderosae]|nr:hypothetical protein HUJ04_008278 [Dendroctonus ponderosae]